MTETVRIELPKGQWVRIGAGVKNLTAQKETVGGVVRLWVGSVAPAGSVGLVVTDAPASLSDLGPDDVWMRAESFG